MTGDGPRHKLGRQLALTRKAAGYNQYQFAAKLHYSRSTVSNAEIGHPDVARRFCGGCPSAVASLVPCGLARVRVSAGGGP